MRKREHPCKPWQHWRQLAAKVAAQAAHPVTHLLGHRRQLQQAAPAATKHTPLDGQRAQEIFDRLCQLMEHDRLYANKLTDREQLAQQLGTNRTYLSAIVKEKSGMTLPQFVNAYRIREAVRLLSSPGGDRLSMGNLARQLGYSSQSTFFRVFRQAMGISPAAFREQRICQSDSHRPGTKNYGLTK